MSWIVTEEDGDLYAKAKALGADEICLATKRRTEVYIANKSSGNAVKIPLIDNSDEVIK
eukprot:CAMPEP_0196765446 /NCGR_PEP_ID=MMETSP1095-20130614/8877_1 /TAXON_ID=96789 ORGANISM="Chromulina nebulosa, Strain UTEXLB2642" /NCGR_SAMPLE_ID=MMETSP1095 /ASSEMBLY_ACC=CAM_ASM_000446 /LENGTH=58 /DNA_ID=CAMNT_0042123483 /DNA_START=62 /DNA_END=235 /DNA_ORIENTATION=-